MSGYLPLPPLDHEAEEYVLGAMMLSAHAIDAVSEILDHSDFERETHGTIYRAALDLHEEGVAVDAITISDRLAQDGTLAEVGGKERIREIASLVPGASNAAHHARVVRRMARLREQDEVGRALCHASTNGGLEHDPALLARVAGLLSNRVGSRKSFLIDAAELLSRPDPGPTPWLIEGLIVNEAILACVGRWKTLKSLVTLHLGMCVATGRPAFGRFTVAEPGPVVFVMEESGEDALWRRLDMLCRGQGVDPEELRGRLHLSANARVKLDDRGWQAELLAVGREIRPRLTVFDPLARLKDAARDENDQKDMAALIEFMRQLRDETRSATGFIHHTGHQGIHMRGSSDLESAWESRLAFDRDKAVIALTSEHRDAEDSALKLHADWDETSRTLRFRVDDTAPEANVKAPADLIAMWIRGRGGEATPKEIRDQFNITDGTLRARREALASDGISYVDDGRGSRYVEARDPSPRNPATVRGRPLRSSKPQLQAETTPQAGNPAMGEAAGKEMAQQSQIVSPRSPAPLKGAAHALRGAAAAPGAAGHPAAHGSAV